jgi:hypothetical protein
MTQLSKKQQANIERKWELEAESKSIDIQMADAVRSLWDHHKVLEAQINALENQVPESVQNTWDAADMSHPNFISEPSRESWLESYRLLAGIHGGWNHY